MRSINAWSQGFSNLLVLVCKVGAYTVGQSNALDKVINQLIRTLKKAARMDVLNPYSVPSPSSSYLFRDRDPTLVEYRNYIRDLIITSLISDGKCMVYSATPATPATPATSAMPVLLTLRLMSCLKS